MKHLSLKAIASALMLGITTSALGVPANRTPRPVTLPDGSTITLVLVGDEYHHAYFTTDHYAVMRNADGYFCYATLDSEGNAVPSAVRAHDEAQRNAAEMSYADRQPHEAIARALDKAHDVQAALRAETSWRRLTPLQAQLAAEAAATEGPSRKKQLDSTYPTKGAQKGLVVLVQYTDVSFRNDSATTHDYFSNMLNQEGFTENRGFGSTRDFFLASSKGQFEPTFDVYGPITLSHNRAYYGGNSGYGGQDQRPHLMAVEACQAIDSYVDFNEYDRDHDGEVDNVYVFYAGLGEANGGSSETVWPHSWDVRYGGSYVTLDGVQLGHYACSNEIEPSRVTGQNELEGIGTFTHEFSHVLGLPDLYATSYTNAFTPGAWDILDYGPYNDDGHRPPYYTAYERYEMGWLAPTEIANQAETYRLRPINYNEAYIIRTERSNEYFLFENRQQESWDSAIPGHGMLAWHIDYNASVWNQNTVNNSASHQYVDIEEADGSQSEYSRDGDSFPGRSNVTSFTDDTNPSMKSWSGHRQERPITNIQEVGGIITFDVLGGRIPLPTVQIEGISDVQPDGFTVHWETNDSALFYRLSVYTLVSHENGRVTVNYAEGYSSTAVGDTSAWTVRGLVPATDYYVTIATADSLYTGLPSTPYLARTGDPTFEYLAPTPLAATDVTGSGFVANWEPMDEADRYEIDVYQKTMSDPDDQVEQHFDAGLKLGKNWRTNVSVTYSSAANAGDSLPSLRFSADQDYIETVRLDDDIRAIEFWHRAISAATGNHLLAQVSANGTNWVTLASITPKTTRGGVRTYLGLGSDIEIPENARQFRLLYDRQQTASIAIDDIIVGYGGHTEISSLPGLDELQIEETRYPIGSLEAEQVYYYRVRAFKGDLPSQWSEEVRVVTDKFTSIEQVRTSGSGDAPCYDLQGRRLSGKPAHGLYIQNGTIVFPANR